MVVGHENKRVMFFNIHYKYILIMIRIIMDYLLFDKR